MGESVVMGGGNVVRLNLPKGKPPPPPPPPVDLVKLNLKGDQVRQKEFSQKDLENLTKALNRVLDSLNVQARFFVHKQTDTIVFQIINAQTNQLIREIPSVKILDMVAKFVEMMGILVDQRA